MNFYIDDTTSTHPRIVLARDYLHIVKIVLDKENLMKNAGIDYNFGWMPY